MPIHSKHLVASAAFGGTSLLIWWLARRRRSRSPSPSPSSLEEKSSPGGGVDAGGEDNKGNKKKSKVAVDRKFLERLRRLLKIVLPSIRSKEFGLLLLHTAFLVVRTFVSIYVAELDGAITKTIVEKNMPEFIKRLGSWLLIAVPATYINSMIRSPLLLLLFTLVLLSLTHSYWPADIWRANSPSPSEVVWWTICIRST